MRIICTPEMNRLREIYEPYEEGCHLAKDAPKEAIEAREKFIQLFKEEKERNRRIDLL